MKSFNLLSGPETVESYLTDLIKTYQYNHYADLTFDQKCEAVALLIENYPVQDIYECFIESDVIGNMAAIIVSLKRNTAASREVMAETIQNNIIRYFEKNLEITFYECVDEIDTHHETWTSDVKHFGDPDHDYDQHREMYG